LGFQGESLRKIETIEFSQVAKLVVVPNSGSNPYSASAPPPTVTRQLHFSFPPQPCCPLAAFPALPPAATRFAPCRHSGYFTNFHSFEIATAMVLMER
jgi:hypothetical protein